MKKIKHAMFALVMLFVGCQLVAEPVNLDLAKHTVLKYVKSGEYNKEMAAQYVVATNDLMSALKLNSKAKNKKRLAVVFDIDETSLSNLSYMIPHNFCKNFKKESVYFDEAKDPAISSALTFYHYAVDHGVSVFFITGRPGKLRAPTVKNLKSVGYKHFVKLYMTPKNYYKLHHSAIPFKSSKRKAITQMGYTIAVNVGDQYSDLKGGYSEYTVKLPDPFYYIS